MTLPRPASTWGRTAVLGAVASAVALALIGPPSVTAEGTQGRRLDDIYIVAEFNDGYWEWYHSYLEQRDEQRRTTTEIRIQLSVLAAERKRLRAEWLRFLYAENQLTPASEYDQGWIGYLGEIAGESRREVDDVVFRWSAGLFGVPLAPEASDAALELTYQTKRDEHRARINQLKERQSELIDEAWRLNRELEQLCHEQKKKSGDRRPWLNAEKERLDDELTILEVQLYDAAQWYLPDELPALIDRLDLDNTATEEVAKLLRAKVSLANAAWNDEKSWLQMTSPRKSPPDPEWVKAARAPRLQAIVDLRRVIEINPENADARGMLMEQELYWLREIAAKVDLESRASIEAFRGYLSARGFYADQPQGWSQSAYEVISAIWGLGPIALTAGLPGLDVAGARATELDVTQTAAARNQVALLGIMRLVKNGAPLAEIPGMTPDEVAKRMTLHTAEGRVLPPGQARRMVQDMRDTFADLDDLRLLASADPQYLVEDVNRAFGKAYFAPLDPTYTWYESFGDLLNVHNICLMWGPGAVAKIDGKWAGVRSMTGKEIQTLEEAGTLITGRQLFLDSVGLTRLAETVSSTGIGIRVNQVLAADRAAMTRGGAVTNLANMGGRLSSALVLYSGATYLGTQAGVSGAGLLVEIIGELGPVRMLSDVAARADVPLDELGTRLDEFGRLLNSQKEELASSARYLDELEELVEDYTDDAIDASKKATIEARAAEIVEEVREQTAARPAVSVTESVDKATTAAAKALEKGDATEAQRAITGGAKMAGEAGERLDESVNKLATVIEKVKSAGDGSSIKVLSPDQLKTINELYRGGLPESFWRPDLYGEGEIGRCLQLGDEAIQKGNLEEAAEHFRAAERLILQSDRPPSFRNHRDLARDRLDLVVNAQRLRKDVEAWRRLHPPGNTTTDIDDDTAKEVLESFDSARAAGGETLTSANEVRLIHDSDGNAYYVKSVPEDRVFDLEEIDTILGSEAASSGLARRVDEIERGATSAGIEHDGLNVPAMRYDTERRLLITRAIPSSNLGSAELEDFPEFVALTLKKEYAKQRLFRAWLGDSDGHLRNIIIGDDGRAYTIDFDMAMLSGDISRQIEHEPLSTPKEIIQRTVTVWRDPHSQRVGGPPYAWMARLDETISYDDVRPTIEAIQELASKPEDLKDILRAAGYPDVDAAAKTLVERAKVLDEAARELFNGGLLRSGAALDRAAHLDRPTAFPPLFGADSLRLAKRFDQAIEPIFDRLQRAA